jgi:hypothetical protein
MPSFRMAVNALLLIIILIIDDCFDKASHGPLKSNINTDRRRVHSLFFVLLHGCQDMSESSSKIYLVAGASRGVGRLPSSLHLGFLPKATDLPSSAGLALVDEIAAKDSSAIIYAGARDPINGASQLLQLAAKYPGRIQIVKYVSGDKDGNEAIATEIGAKYGRIDTAIVTAGALPVAVLLMRTHIIFLGISNYVGKMHETPVEQFTEHFNVRLLLLGKNSANQTRAS